MNKSDQFQLLWIFDGNELFFFSLYSFLDIWIFFLYNGCDFIMNDHGGISVFVVSYSPIGCDSVWVFFFFSLLSTPWITICRKKRINNTLWIELWVDRAFSACSWSCQCWYYWNVLLLRIFCISIFFFFQMKRVRAHTHENNFCNYNQKKKKKWRKKTQTRLHHALKTKMNQYSLFLLFYEYNCFFFFFFFSKVFSVVLVFVEGGGELSDLHISSTSQRLRSVCAFVHFH